MVRHKTALVMAIFHRTISVYASCKLADKADGELFYVIEEEMDAIDVFVDMPMTAIPALID